MSEEPQYEAEDIGCSCTKAGVESEWEWNPEHECYYCVSCLEVQ